MDQIDLHQSRSVEQADHHRSKEDPSVVWRRSDFLLYATVRSDDGRLYHLVVEKLPYPTGWDWAVWQDGHSQFLVRSGLAEFAQHAMNAAEVAIRKWI